MIIYEQRTGTFTKTLGWSDFRPGQKEVIDASLLEKIPCRTPNWWREIVVFSTDCTAARRHVLW